MRSPLPGAPAPRPNPTAEFAWHAATIGLGVVLVAQALRTRRRVARLGEPSGARCGSDGAGAPLRLLIAGDSAAAGVGAQAQDEALAGQLVAQLRPDFRVDWKLFAQTGNTVKDLIARLHAAPAERFDAAVVSIGVNDVTGRTSSAAWIERQSTLLELLASKFGVQHIVLASLPPMHRFPALPQPLRWYLGMRAKQLNAMLQAIAAADARCEFQAFEFPFANSYMAVDGFHPSASGYSVWAEATAGVIRRRMAEA